MAQLPLTWTEQVNAVWTTAPLGPAYPREIPRQKNGLPLLSCLTPLPQPHPDVRRSVCNVRGIRREALFYLKTCTHLRAAGHPRMHTMV